MTDDSLDTIAKGFHDLGDSVKAVALFSQAGASILSLKKNVENILKEAEKINVVDSDFQEYKKELHVSVDILITLEEPCKQLTEMSTTLMSTLNQVINDKQLTSEVVSKLKLCLDEAHAVATDLKGGVVEFVNAMKRVREFCLSAIKNLKAEAERLEKAASSKRAGGVAKGAALGGLGLATAAVALGIASVVTGGAALVVVGAGVVVAGGAVLSASELAQKAAEFSKALKGMELAKKGVEGLEKDMENGIVKLSAGMLTGVEAGLVFFGKMEEDRRKLEASAKMNEQLQDENVQLQDKNAQLQNENAVLWRKVEELTKSQKK